DYYCSLYYSGSWVF
nr:immunoglobulin light chain junction region [Macaca mulatta]MOX79441.1 immunoglobulin light chain junction region [Macaca mulatta]MOX79659.1 immunoglobulin light chain junction region [Macaca mulatta]MOX84276.1 immunoglobulin light chain junction region [Macaca mulatta]